MRIDICIRFLMVLNFVFLCLTTQQVAPQEFKILWKQPLPSLSMGSPAIADLDGDGWLDVVVGMYFGDKASAGGVYAFRGKDGHKLWEFRVPYGPVDTSIGIIDVDKDGKQEIFFGASGGGPFYCINHDGKVRWKIECAKDRPEVFDSPPSFADIEGDGRIEVIFGSTFFSEKEDSDKLIMQGYVRVVDADKGTEKKRITFQQGGIQSEPALYDINKDKTSDFIVTTYTGDQKVYAVSGKDGSILWSYEYPDSDQYGMGAYHGVAIGNIDDDEDPEIMATSYTGYVYVLNLQGKLKWKYKCDAYIFAPATLHNINDDKKNDVLVVDGNGIVYAINGKGELIWKNSMDGTFGDGERGVVISDLTGDKLSNVILLKKSGELIVLNAKTGRLEKRFKPDMEGEGSNYSGSAPVIADFNKDGRMEVFYVHAKLSDLSKADEAKKVAQAVMIKTQGTGPPWLTFKGNNHRTGFAR
jgi:outer membrane protein assembly factor BamB